MNLLNELLDLKESIDYEMLLEDLGKLKDLGIGRMVNAFKQSYHGYDRGRGRNRQVGVSTSEIGNKLNTYTGIGAGSEAIGIPKVSSWSTIKKAYKTNEAARPAASVFYVNNKAVALMIADSYDIGRSSAVVGLSWDFTGTSASNEDIEKMVKPLAKAEKGYKDTGERESNAKSKETHERETTEHGPGADKMKLIVKHYQGVGQYVSTCSKFFDSMFEVFGPNVKMKLITSDAQMSRKRGERYGNASYAATKTSDLSLFKDDLKTRLAKYKNTKVTSVEDMQEFVAKVFSGSGVLKKLSFAGLTYEAVPKARELGSNDSRKHEKEFRVYYNSTMRDLFLGREVAIEFESDKNANQYHSLYISVKFKDGMIKATKARYYDMAAKEYKEETL